MKPKPVAKEGGRRARAGWRQLLKAAGTGADELVQLVLDTTSDAVFVVDAERNILIFNRRAEEITGIGRAEVLGRHCLTGFRCEHCLESCSVFKRGQIRGTQVELIRPEGRRVLVTKDAVVVRDRLGRAIGAIEVFRERASTTLGSASADDLAFHGAEAVLASLGRGVVVVDGSLVVERGSTAFAELVGEEPQVLRGRPAVTWFGEDLLGPQSAFARALLAGERREGWRAGLARRDGTRQPVSVSGAPLSAEGCDGKGANGQRFVLVVRPEAILPDDGTDQRSPMVFEGMVGCSPQMRRVFDLVEHQRDSDATVLITGASGTGKELLARAIHARSPQAQRPFVAINCAALPENLLESELFGHARGAFTGAVRDKSGRFEVVEDGTLFLDEIGDLSLPLQVKLLRVLQERTFERVGENTARAFKGRVLAATHQDLLRAVAAKSFREDLFYRLNVLQIRIPPLRERREDIEPLAAHLLEKIGQRRSRSLRLSPSALRALYACEWPGNVRQLENALEYATAVCGGQTIHVDDLPPEVVQPAAPQEHAEATATSPRDAVLDAYPSASEIVEALKKTRRRRGEAAQLLKVSRTTLWRRMRELSL